MRNLWILARLRPRATVSLLLAVAAVEIALAAVLRSTLLVHLLRGEHTWIPVLGALGLAWLVLMLGMTVWAVRRIGGLARTVTEREDHLAAVHATSREWLWEATADFVFTSCSPGVAAVLGYRPEDLVGRSFYEFLEPDDHAQARAVQAEAVRTGTGWRDVEIRWRHADGHLVVFQGSAVPVLDAHGRVLGFRGSRRLLTGHDETQRRWEAIHRRVTGVLEGGGLRVALQPIVHIDRQVWSGVEAMARFPDNRPPDMWFTEAHEVGLGVELELEAARAAIAALAELPPSVYLSFNASPQLVCDDRFPDLFTAPGAALDRLVLEITEHTAVSEYAEVHAALTGLRERGLRLAVDDTGAGYASFSHVLRLRPDLIKLDRSLLVELTSDPARRVLVTAIVLLGLELGAAVTAEGVETLSELQALAALGVDYAQGYLLARPTTDPARWRAWKLRRWPTANLAGAPSEPRQRQHH